MEILSENQIFLRHSLEVMTVDQVDPNLANRLFIGQLGFLTDPTLELQNRNISAAIGYGDFVNLSVGYTLVKTNDQIYVTCFLGNLKLHIGYISTDDVNGIWNFLYKDQPKITALYNPKDSSFWLIDENVAIDEGLKVIRPSYINSFAKSNQYQAFQASIRTNYDDRDSIDESDSVTIPINSKLQQLFNHPDANAAAQELNSICRNADITLSSSYMSPDRKIYINKEGANSAVVDNIKAELFSSYALGPNRNFQVQLLNGGKDIIVNNFSDYGFDTDALEFVSLPGSYHNSIRMIKKFSREVFTFGEITKLDGSTTNLLPILKDPNASWTCLYWPDSKVQMSDDGLAGTNFTDYIYLFKNFSM